MNYKELQERFYELESLNQVTRINKATVEEVYEGLTALSEDFMSTYFHFEEIEDYRELENIKIKISESILLCRISRNALLGISNRHLELELDDFYNSNGRVD